MARSFDLEILDYANVGNHLHVVLKARDPQSVGRFLRALSGLVVRCVLRAEKGAPADEAFWTQRLYSPAVSSWRDLGGLDHYVHLNRLESLGCSKKAAQAMDPCAKVAPMSLLTQAETLRRAVKNVGRMSEIVAAMTRFGFGTVVQRTGLATFLPGRTRAPEPGHGESTTPTPERLRRLMEQLGPSFIKVGQVLAGRPDLVPADFVREFEKLQDHAPPVEFSLLKPVVEAELGRSLEACFSSFDTEPLATASIAQVHAARTLEGDDIVVKIRKPGVDRMLAQDLEILELIAQLLERYIDEVRPFRPQQIIVEFKRTLLEETDFRLEAQNIRRFRENFAGSTFLVIPKVYADLSSDQVLTMERIRGVKLSDLDSVRAMGLDPRELLRQGIDHFFQSVMRDGLFHADPHAGNLMALPDGRMGLIDFGSVGRLSARSKDAIVNMFLALLAQDYDALILEYLDMSPSIDGSRSTSNIERIQREVALIVTPYHGLPLSEIPSGKVLMEATRVAFRYNVSLPRDLVLVFKAIMTLEGIGRSLDPDFDLISAASKYARVLLQDRYNPSRLGKDALFLARDLSRLLKSGPRQFAESLRQLESGELKFNLQVLDLDRASRRVSIALTKIALAVLASSLVLSATWLMVTPGQPLWINITAWSIAIGVGFWTYLRVWR